jgi:hypothetical protein
MLYNKSGFFETLWSTVARAAVLTEFFLRGDPGLRFLLREKFSRVPPVGCRRSLRSLLFCQTLFDLLQNVTLPCGAATSNPFTTNPTRL